MKLAKIEDLHCDAGWRTFSFLKLTTDDGLVGWSEYTEADGSRGLTGVIRGLAEPLIGLDPRPVQQIASMLWVRQVQAPGGINSRAIAAIENALLDIKGKALGRAGVRAVRRAGARAHPGVLVALRLLSRAQP